MADVLLARDGDRHVVAKRIRAEQAGDERYVAMFLDEARLASSVRHPNVVQVHDIGEHDGEYFFTMEYVHGEDARRLLTVLSKRDELVPLQHVIAIVSAAAAGLHHAHEARGADGRPLGIVHRDVSPANILLGYDGQVKMADFGIAKATRRNVETQTGTLKGKVAYMSPEQCVGEEMDRRSDVFSLGIVLYELLTVRRLFKGDNDFLTMTSIVLGHIPPPSKYRADLPEALETIIFKALENQPDDRYQTADELRIALEQFAEEHELDASPAAFAAYMHQVFGAKPMPWADSEPDVELSVDFDGSASGVVAPVIDKMLSGRLAIDAPLRRAQTATEVLESAEVAPSVIVEPVSAGITTCLERPRKRSAWLVGGAAAFVLAALALVVVVTRSESTAAPRPVAAVVPQPPQAPPRSDEPTVPPNLAATQAAPEEPPAIAPPVKRPRMGPAKKKVPPKTMRVKANAKPNVKADVKTEPARWSPEALFPR